MAVDGTCTTFRFVRARYRNRFGTGYGRLYTFFAPTDWPLAPGDLVKAHENYGQAVVYDLDHRGEYPGPYRVLDSWEAAPREQTIDVEPAVERVILRFDDGTNDFVIDVRRHRPC